MFYSPPLSSLSLQFYLLSRSRFAVTRRYPDSIRPKLGSSPREGFSLALKVDFVHTLIPLSPRYRLDILSFQTIKLPGPQLPTYLFSGQVISRIQLLCTRFRTLDEWLQSRQSTEHLTSPSYTIA